MPNATSRPVDAFHPADDPNRMYGSQMADGSQPTNGPHPAFGVVTVGCLLFAAAGIMYLVKSVTRSK